MGLKQKSLSGFIWTSAGILGNGVVSFIVTMILARMLMPEHFALIALLHIFLTTSNVIVDSGFSQAIIRDDNPTEVDLSSVFYFNLILSLFLYAVLFFAAPYISSFFKSPDLIVLSRVVFLVIIFNAFSIIQNATLNRSLNFAAVNKSSVIGSFLAGGISIIMAFTGFGIWALVANMVLLPFFRSILLWYHSDWRPRKTFSFHSVKRYFAFGGFLMLQGIIDTISTNLISLIIGKSYTKNDLGYYSQGGKLDGYIISPFSVIIKNVTYPILSKIKHEEDRLKDAYRQIVGVVMLVFIPTILFTIATSENMIVTLFGSKWYDAGVYLRIAAFGAVLFPLQNICGNIALIKGKTKLLFRFTMIKQVVRIALLLLFIKKGVLMLAFVYTISTLFGSVLYILLGMNLLNYSIKELFHDLYKTIIVSLVGITIAILIEYLISGYNTMFVFAIQSVIMLVIYYVGSRIIKNEYYKEAITMIKPLLLRFKK